MEGDLNRWCNGPVKANLANNRSLSRIAERSLVFVLTISYARPAAQVGGVLDICSVPITDASNLIFCRIIQYTKLTLQFQSILRG